MGNEDLIDELTVKIEELEEEQERLTQKIGQLEEAPAESNETIEELTKERNDLKIEVRNLQKNIDTALKYLGNVQDSLT